MIVDTPIGGCYDSAMATAKIEKLGNLVSSVVAEIAKLRSENHRLTEMIEELQKSLGSASAQNLKANAQLQELVSLENSHRKMESNKSKVRKKVQTLLKELEKIDIN